MNLKNLNKKLLEYMDKEGNTDIYQTEEGYDVFYKNKLLIHFLNNIDEIKDYLFDKNINIKDVEIYDSYTGYLI